MNEHPIDPHTIPLERAFPSLKPEEREAMREFLDGYCEVAWQVWERLENERLAQGMIDTRDIRKVVDIIKREHKKNAA